MKTSENKYQEIINAYCQQINGQKAKNLYYELSQAEKMIFKNYCSLEVYADLKSEGII